MHGRPAECNHATEATERPNDVEWPCSIREEVGDNSAENRGSIEDDEEVEGYIFVGDIVGSAVRGYIIEWDVHSHKSEEGTEQKEIVRDGAKDVLVEEWAAFGREGLGPHDKHRNREGCEHDKGYNACCPSKPDAGLQFVEDDGIDYPS
jgi:hypothetical protein